MKRKTQVTAVQFGLSLYPIAVGNIYFRAAGVVVPLAGAAGWLAIVIAFAVGLLWVLLTAKLSRWAPKGGFAQAVFTWWGRWIGSLVLIYLAAVGLWLGSLILLEGSMVFHSIALPATPPLTLTLCTLFLMVISDLKGIEVYLRTVQFLTLLGIPLLLGILWGTAPLMKLENLMPLLGTGPAGIAHATYLSLTWAMDGILFTLFLGPLVNDQHRLGRASVIAVAFAGFTISMMVVVTVGTLGLGFTESYIYPSAQLALNAPFGGFLSGLELLFYPLWLVSTYVKSTAFFMLASESVGGLLPVLKQPWRGPLLGLVCLLLSSIPESSLAMVAAIGRVTNSFVASLSWLLPLLAIVAWQRRNQHAN